MSKIKKTAVTKADIWLISILIIASLTGIFFSIKTLKNTSEKYCQISVDSKVIKTITLREGYTEKITIETENKDNNLKNIFFKNPDTKNLKSYNIIEIKNGTVEMIKADCPDQICVKSGLISIPSQQIVCLPNKVIVKVISKDENEDELDDITR
ncbi:NusG domain II-containing protein [Selenomonadales bacterium OttesenSCG-928-I06]|nr:NusG domain II-containing protein [Selenomonadales bacterium OttesenSCG-928-I06]